MTDSKRLLKVPGVPYASSSLLLNINQRLFGTLESYHLSGVSVAPSIIGSDVMSLIVIHSTTFRIYLRLLFMTMSDDEESNVILKWCVGCFHDWL